jgi:transcriptional regulator with XRE-family HTH domain
MPRASPAKTSLPPPVAQAIKRLGRDVAVARRRRRLPQRLMAERMLVSLQTLQRLEAGEPGVGLSVLASALFVLGLFGRLEHLVAPDSDVVGKTEELSRLPRRAHAPQADPELDF